MRKIIYTVSVDPGNCFNKCVESQKEYAQKVRADFLVRTNWQNWNEDLKTDCEKRYIIDLLEYYDKVLYLDADVFIKKDSPDIFKKYENNNNLIIYNEVLYNNVQMDDHIIKLVNKYQINWNITKGHYDWLNAGVILATKNRMHELAFYYNKADFFKIDSMPMIYDMPFMHHNIYMNKIPVSFLDEKFNTMVYFHSNGYFLHFANVLDRDKRINEYV